MSPARRLTPLRRWRLRRDLVIVLASRDGASLRMLADVFDLTHPAIFKVLKRMNTNHAKANPHDDES